MYDLLPCFVSRLMYKNRVCTSKFLSILIHIPNWNLSGIQPVSCWFTNSSLSMAVHNKKMLLRGHMQQFFFHCLTLFMTSCFRDFPRFFSHSFTWCLTNCLNRNKLKYCVNDLWQAHAQLYDCVENYEILSYKNIDLNFQPHKLGPWTFSKP